MIAGVAWLLLANAASLLGAHALLRRLASGHADADLLVLLLLRLFLISAGVLIAGVCGILTATGLGLMALVGLVALVATGAHRDLPRPRLPRPGWMLGILTVLVLARLLAQVWFFAPYTSDALSYHLPKIGEWVRAGAFTRELGVDSHAAFPTGFELIPRHRAELPWWG